MKPPSFAYHRPTSVAEAVQILAEAGEGGKVLAGGQSLVPLLNMRLAAPSALVDINRLTELAYVDTDEATVRVGSLARHAQTEMVVGQVVDAVVRQHPVPGRKLDARRPFRRAHLVANGITLGYEANSHGSYSS